MIPQPHVVAGTDNANCFSPSSQPVVYWSAQADDRHLYHVKRIFDSDCETGSIAQGYAVQIGTIPGVSLEAEQKRCEERLDAYSLYVGETGMLLCSLKASGLFYGLLTVEKILSERKGLPIGMRILDYADMEIRTDYWDLRSIHPPFENMLKNIPLIAGAKLNAVVIEYEDKLAIEEPFHVANSQFCFTPEQFSELKRVCALWFVEIIPLQQSFGHLEYVLKDPAFSHLRETELAVGDLCPMKPESASVARQLVAAMAKKHPDSRYLHIGCDEVWSLGSCEACKASGKSRMDLFIDFVNQVIDAAAEEGKTPLLWHDMFEKAAPEQLARLDKRAIVCIWLYNGNDLVVRIGELIDKLEAAQISYWACPAMRAWDADDRQNYPVLINRISNIEMWHELVRKYKIPGMINTNWAACFALAKPYGVYETSFYPMYYSAEKCWNEDADSETFMQRFFWDFHGYDASQDPTFARGYQKEDFYELLGNLDGKLPRRNEIAHLVHVLREFEEPTRRFFPLTVVLYRQEFFKSSDEVGSLRGKYLALKNTLDDVKPRLEKELSNFLPPYAVAQFLRSRYLIEELILHKAEEFLKK